MARQDSRERYCELRATTLEEVLATCERHISNINKTEADLHAEDDGTPTDFFYCDMFREAWADLRDDVKAMLEKSQEPVPEVTRAVYLVEHTEYERGWGQRPDGYTVHKSLADAEAFVKEKTSGRGYPTPDVYVSYDVIRTARPCSAAFGKKIDEAKNGRMYIDRQSELMA